MIDNLNNLSAIDNYVEQTHVSIMQKILFWLVFVIINILGFVNIKYTIDSNEQDYKIQKLILSISQRMLFNVKNYTQSEYLNDYIKHIKKTTDFNSINNNIVIHNIINNLSDLILDKNFYVVDSHDDLIPINSDLFLDAKEIYYTVLVQNLDNALLLIKTLESKLDVYNKIISLNISLEGKHAKIKLGFQSINLLNEQNI
jgi:hypothetical protein